MVCWLGDNPLDMQTVRCLGGCMLQSRAAAGMGRGVGEECTAGCLIPVPFPHRILATMSSTGGIGCTPFTGETSTHLM